MARYGNPAPGSQTEAINRVADQAVLANSAKYNAITTSSPTLSAAQMVNGIVKVSGQTDAQTVTTPSAAALIAEIPNAQVGSSFDFVLINAHTSSGAVTVAAGSGVSLKETTAVPITKTQLYKGIVTNVGTPAVDLIGLLTAPV